ncbi:class I SAM-dependent methyltransferase [Pseudanabaena sp. 'Roaring Creek']|uniref:class I SAM-dependent methyltransferase n=1 Tax=Pseudanabaena sp. 'Roaring Creek' TaxID=1681830 RepID=UPI0006D818BD|nr:class I SAM-dependent methyltransferase [Pseudanabaena sp. 'Roaring Creek']
MNCRVCDSTNLELAVDLGSQPWCNHFLKSEEIGKEPFYPLRLLYCQDCETVQLDYTVKKEIMFGNHTYLSGVTKSLSEHFKTVAQEVDKRFFEDLKSKCVLDIGSNDGTQLQHFKALGYDVLGVESSKTTAKIANDSGITTLNEFFNLELVQRLNRKFHIINAAGVFFHLEELHSVSEGIREALRDDGVFVVQFLYMKRIVENLAFDQIYHEHLLYYNLKNIEVLLNRHGLAMFDAYLSPIHGGSIVGFVTHKGNREISDRLQTLRQAETDARSNEFATYLEFGERIKQMKLQNLSYLEAAKKEGKKIFGFGAPVKGNTMLNYFGVGTQYLDCLVEKNELRRNLYSPGMHIPIVIEKEVFDLPDIYYVLAWNFKKEILANNQHLIDKGIEFYFPVNPKEV